MLFNSLEFLLFLPVVFTFYLVSNAYLKGPTRLPRCVLDMKSNSFF